MAENPDLWKEVFSLAKKRYKVPIRSLLKLPAPWESFPIFTRTDTLRVVQEACGRAAISDPTFWLELAQHLDAEYLVVQVRLEKRYRDLEQDGVLSELPPRRHGVDGADYEH